MTLVVGIGLSHDSSTAAIVDGKLVFALEDERVNRFKHSIGPSARPFIDADASIVTFAKMPHAGHSLVLLEKFLKENYDLSVKDAEVIAVAGFHIAEMLFIKNMRKEIKKKPYLLITRARNIYHFGAHMLERYKVGFRQNAYAEKIWFGETAVIRKINSIIRPVSYKPDVNESGGIIDKIGKFSLPLAEYLYTVKVIFSKKEAETLLVRAARKLIKRFLGYDISENKFIVVKHHLAHAATAYYFSGRNSLTVVVADGAGEDESTTVWRVKNGEFEKVFSTRHSLGGFFEGIALCLGLGSHLEGPPKLMGLAPYGTHDEKVSKILRKVLKVYSPDSEIPYEVDRNTLDKIVRGEIKLCPKWNRYERPINQQAANVAYEAQKLLEEAYLTLAEWAKKRVGIPYLGLAGGVALNAKANMELYYAKIYDDLFIFPGANDAGLAVGAAAWAYEHVLGLKMKNERIKDVYWGYPYGEEEIRKALKLARDLGLKVEYVGSPEVLVDYLVKGQFMAFFQGRAEFGPRALGHRSLLADPRKAEHWERMNKVKGREWWRPLAPSLLLEDAPSLFKDPTEAPFMILMFKYKDEEACKTVPAVCHVDMTARPQTVTPEIDKNWYSLIKAFKQETGIGVVMNTSFNLGGEPLVDSPAQAILSYLFMFGMKGLWLEGWLILRD